MRTKLKSVIKELIPKIYDASFPAWFLNEEKFLGLFENKYDLVAVFDAFDTANIASAYFVEGHGISPL